MNVGFAASNLVGPVSAVVLVATGKPSATAKFQASSLSGNNSPTLPADS
jgi:hypothetical protein